ncbi:hypothetical protein APHAL10511_004024 [Amanita phalloides]|nr:hypothetical protein APHAL10511_004024 [Amanita phalloides]
MNPRPVGGISPRPIITLRPPLHPVHVLDVTPDDSANDIYLVPPDTTFRLVGIARENDPYPLPSLVHSIPKDGYNVIRSGVVATTPSGVTILIPERPDILIHVRMSRNPIICLSAYNDESRVIYSMDLEKVEDWCRADYLMSVAPDGMRRPKLDDYMRRCTFANLPRLSTSTNVEANDHWFVHVPVIPIPHHQPRVEPGHDPHLKPT